MGREYQCRVESDLNTYLKKQDERDDALERYLASLDDDIDHAYDIVNSIKNEAYDVDGYDFRDDVTQYIKDRLCI
jgi:hypothetical protein